MSRATCVLKVTVTLLTFASLTLFQNGPRVSSIEASPDSTPASECPVTPYSEYGLEDDFTSTWFGDGALVAGLYLADAGVWYADPDGPKVHWLRPAGESLTVQGRRLDGPAPPLDVDLPKEYATAPFQVSRLRFPTEGCWEVVGRIPQAELRFVVWVHPGDQYRSATPVPQDVWEALDRPLGALPPAADDSCPRSAETQVERVEGMVLGDGPVYVQGLGADGVVRIEPVVDSDARVSVAVRLAANPISAGPLLIREHRLDRPEAIGFGPEGSVAALQRWGMGESTPPDWRVWREYVTVPGSGCYALQFDGLAFTEVIVFEVV